MAVSKRDYYENNDIDDRYDIRACGNGDGI